MTRQGRLRVLAMVDGFFVSGGGESLAREIAQRLDPDRFEAALCVTRWEFQPEYEPALTRLREAGIRFMGLERRSRLDLAPWRTLLAFMREWRVDVLHTHMFGSNVWGSLLAPRARVPVFVAHEHTWSYSGQPIRKLLDRRLISARADAFVAVSRDDQRKMIEIEGIAPEKTRVIHNGVALEAAREGTGAKIRRELGIGSGSPVIGVVATLRRQKALEILVEAVAILRERFPDLVALVVGGDSSRQGAERSRLSRLAEDLGAGPAVKFLGERSDVPEILDAIDVGVLSSDFEGSPLSVMEYMEAARPVVATRVGGVPDIVAEGETGLLVPPRDPAGLAAGIAQLLDDPRLASRMGEAGRRRRREEFDLADTVRDIEELYEELYARAGAADAGR